MVTPDISYVSPHWLVPVIFNILPSTTNLSVPEGVPSNPSKHVKYPPKLKSFLSSIPESVIIFTVYPFSPDTCSNSTFPVNDLLVAVSPVIHHKLSVVISNSPLKSDCIFSSSTFILPTKVPSGEFSGILKPWSEDMIGSSFTGFIVIDTVTVSTPPSISYKKYMNSSITELLPSWIYSNDPSLPTVTWPKTGLIPFVAYRESESISVSLANRPLVLSTVSVLPSFTVYKSANPIGLSLSGFTVIVTVAVSETRTPSEVLYVNVSDPKKFWLGLYSKLPSEENNNSPLVGNSNKLAVNSSESSSSSFDNTPSLDNTTKELSSPIE